MEKKKLAVVILNWNGSKLLDQFLPAAIKYTEGPDVQLIVADNGSTDDSVEMMRTRYTDVGLITFDNNYGFAEGYNRVIAMLPDFEYVVLLNSDVEVTEGWWQPLVKAMDDDHRIGACQPKIRAYKDKKMFEYAGAAGGYLDVLGYPYCRGRLFDAIEEDEGQYDTDKPVDIAWASGACLMVRREDYLAVGGLDPLFFAHMEEIDLCCRMHGAGLRVVVVTDSVVYHVGGASLNQGNPQKTYLNFRNNLLLLHKNLPRNIGKRKLFMRRLADTLAWGMYVLKGDFPNAKAVLKAHKDFKKMRAHYTDFPVADYISSLPGAKHNAVIDRYLLRKTKIEL